MAHKNVLFYYEANEAGTALVHHRGYLNFTSHIIAGIYVLYFLVNATRMLKGKHKTDAIVLFVCSFFALGAVIIEAFGLANNLLNVTIAISCLFYYLYQYVQHSHRDALTGCFDRGSFYRDAKKFGKSISGVINIDMNGLKTINDTYGHLEGDRAILTISEIIEKSSGKNGYVYRLGGDEFTILVVDGSKEEMEVTISQIKEKYKRRIK